MSLFGNTTNNTQSKPLFGSTSTTTNTSSPFTLGAPAASNNTTQGSSLFGNTANNQSKPLFGATTTSTQPAQSGGLFGATNNAQPQQQQSGSSLFGGALNNNSTATNQQTGSSLFGAQPAAQAQPQQTTSLFGQPAQQQNNATSGGSLFGQTANQNTAQPKPAFSLFGNNSTTQQPQQQQQPQSTSLFNTSTTNPSTSLFNTSTTTRPTGLTLGQSTATSSSTVPGVKIDLSQIRGTTRFNDLHDDLQRQISQIDTFIQSQIAFKEQCDALMPAHAASLATIPDDVAFVSSKLETAELALDNDANAIEGMKATVRRDAENAKLSFKAVENLKLPNQFHYSNMWSQEQSPGRRGSVADAAGDGGAAGTPADIVGYVGATADEFAKTLGLYQRNISEIEEHLRTLEASVVQQGQMMMYRRGRDGAGRSRDEQIRELGDTLRGFDQGIVKVAEHVGQVKEELAAVIDAGVGVGGAYGSGEMRGSFGRR